MKHLLSLAVLMIFISGCNVVDDVDRVVKIQKDYPEYVIYKVNQDCFILQSDVDIRLYLFEDIKIRDATLFEAQKVLVVTEEPK